MLAPVHSVRYSWREYVTLESASNVKHEYLDGQIYAMAGGTPVRAALQLAVPSLMFAQLRVGPCRAYGPDLRVRVVASGLATYPDVTVVCGAREVDPEEPNTVTNPTLIVEVLSPSTEAYDRGEKFEHYKRIARLRQYVLVAQDDHRVEVWTRTGDDWTCTVSRDGDVAALGSVGATLDVRELYSSVS